MRSILSGALDPLTDSLCSRPCGWGGLRRVECTLSLGTLARRDRLSQRAFEDDSDRSDLSNR